MPNKSKSAKRARAKKSGAHAPPSAAPATRKSARVAHAAPAPRRAKKSVRRSLPLVTLGPRIKIGDAMRLQGLDEPRLARLFRGLLSRLNKPRSEKLLLDAIKETCRLLEAYPPSKPAAGVGSLALNVPVNLITLVPRPERALPPGRGGSSAALPDRATTSFAAPGDTSSFAAPAASSPSDAP